MYLKLSILIVFMVLQQNMVRAYVFDEDDAELQKHRSEWRQQIQEYMEKNKFASRPERYQEPPVNFKESALNQTHPRVEAGTELLCFEANTVGGECNATNGSVIFNQDTIYSRPDLTTLNLQGTELKCKGVDGSPCKITFKFNSTFETTMRVVNGSTIAAAAIFIDSPTTQLIIDGTSSLQVNGRSYSSKGSHQGQGASYIGQGGYCGSAAMWDKHYGDFDTIPNKYAIDDNKNGDLLGSVGDSSPLNVNTGGGGRIHINVDSLQLYGNNGQLQANGLPAQDLEEKGAGDLNGGSGGYIYVNTFNIYHENYFDYYASIQAIGGYGKNAGNGGAGGMISFGNNVTSNMGIYHTRTHGGRGGAKTQPANKTDNNCGAAAAGTTFWDNNDVLLINNDWHHTTKHTFLRAKVRSQDKFPGQYMPADHLILASGSVTNIQSSGISSILFDSLQMFPFSSLIFDFTSVRDLTIKYNKHFVVHDFWTSIDFSRATGEVTLQSFVEDEGQENLVALNDVTFTRTLTIDVHHLILGGKIYDPAESEERATSLRFYANQLSITERAEIYADKIFLYSNDTLWIQKDAKVISTKANECSLSPTDTNQDLYMCMADDFDGPAISEQYMLDYFNQQYGFSQALKVTHISKLHWSILKKWNIYMLSLGIVRIEGAEVQGPRIGICSNNIKIENSLVSANGRGCRAEQGPGGGKQFHFCAGQGGAHGGFGGYGGSESSDKTEKAQCKAQYPLPYHAGRDARLDGSGGGNGERRAGQKDTGGAGGGVIWLTTPSTVGIQNSTVSADGKWGVTENYDQFGAGGGSGGSIQITTLNMRGNGHVSVKGGSGSSNGGGGGSGGRLVMNYLKSYLSSSQPDQSFFWTGTDDIQGGFGGSMAFKFQGPGDGQNGTMHHSKCFPGYSGVFCTACEIGWYKSDYSRGVCQKCENKPDAAYYTKYAEITPLCQYQCDQFIEDVSTNADCLDPLQLDYQRIGGQSNFFVILGLFLMISLCVFTMLTYKQQLVMEGLQGLENTLYSEWKKHDQAARGVAPPTAKRFDLRDKEIFHHTDRMYLIGNNSIRNPWVIPKDFSRAALAEEDRQTFIQFIDKINEQLRWTQMETYVYIFISIVMSPLGKEWHYLIRKQKFERIQTALFNAYPPQFWNDKGDNKSLRFGCSQNDFHLAYIDFIDFGRKQDNWEGVKVPMPILLAGNGTYNHPFHLDFVRDPLIKSLSLIDFDYFKNKLPIFMENFNSTLAKLNFFKLEVMVMRDLTKIVQWIEQANRAMFKHFHLKAVLYIIENQMTEVQNGVYKQKRRSFPLETVFFDSFPEMYKTLLRYIKSKSISGRSEIRLCLVFKRYTVKKQVQNEMRIKQMIQDNQGTRLNPFQAAIVKEESVLFDENDNDLDEQRVSVADGVNPTLSDASINKDYGASFDKDPQQQLVDKSMRAFSISIDSSKAFELAIRKPRTKFKHYFARVRAYIYANFLLLMKHHGSPAEIADMTWYFVIYSGILAVDIMLLLNMSIHTFYPRENFAKFGWSFWLLPPFASVFSPSFALSAALTGSVSQLKTVGMFNVQIVLISIPVTIYMAHFYADDPMFIVILLFVAVIKCIFSGISAKIVHILQNPRFFENQLKLKKILRVQKRRITRREELFGADAARDISGTGLFTQTNPMTYSREDEARMRESLLQH